MFSLRQSTLDTGIGRRRGTGKDHGLLNQARYLIPLCILLIVLLIVHTVD
jgi:hypothetical protein